ncbi:MAG: uroporphyrinogen-III synthase [Acidocella sp.]|nr:uroporphyrinogen-III synthase [Acidocella sp.]
MKILVTRPEPGASLTAARLTSMGYEPVVAPCLAISRHAATLPQHPAAIIVTSSQVIPALPERYRNTPIFCVGDATAGRLREAGFNSVISASGDAKDLAALIIAHRLPGSYLLAVGARHGLALAQQLRKAGLTITRRTVYAATPARALPPAVRTALQDGSIKTALFYSAESARAFIKLNPPNTANVTALALSPNVAAVLHDLPWTTIRVALAPTEADLLAYLT